MAKRAFDILFALLGLAIFALPMALIALWVRLDSPGPVLFRQPRVGQGGRMFHIHKFRTMAHATAGSGPLITAGNDARITRAGQWLRHSKLDELPQLLDVLRGDMSIVGPRPEVVRYVGYYPPGPRDKILAVKPGITDLASLYFRREQDMLAAAADPEREYIDRILPQKLAYAQAYVDRASLWQDLRIVGLTIVTILLRR